MPTTKTGPQIIKRNPFEETPVPRAFYHPGSAKRLSKHDRKTALSPDRRYVPESHQSVKTSHDQLFLSRSHILSENNDPSPKDSSSKFDESWPTSERPSLGEETMRDSQNDVDQFLNLKKRLEFPDRDSPSSSFNQTVDASVRESNKGESTLAKYVERFRRGTPMSREERQKIADRQTRDFWWLSASPPASDIRNDSQTSVTSSKQRPSVSPQRLSSKTRFTASRLASHTSSVVPGDDETRLLQEKADRLLEQSCTSSEISSGPAVSTEGLGSSPSSASVITDLSEEKVYRPAFTRLNTDGYRAAQLSVPTLSRGQSERPEDDILYQWRLKRKMELAKDSAHLAPMSKPSTCSKPQPTATTQLSDMDSKLSEFRQRLSEFGQGSQHPVVLSDHQPAMIPTAPPPSVTTVPVNFTPAPQYPRSAPDPQTDSHSAEAPSYVEQVDEEQTTKSERVKEPPIASPTLHRKMKAKVTDPQPHLHLMCDILPCPHQEEYCLRMRAGESEDSDTDYKEEADVQYKQYLQAERPDSERKKKAKNLPNIQNTALQDTKDISSEKVVLKDSINDRVIQERQSRHSIEKGSVRQKDKHKQYHANAKDNKVEKRKGISRELRRETTPPGLKRSGSPKGQINSAIGQAVKDYLFESSQSIVDSSMESLPTEAAGAESPGQTIITDLADTTEVSSDGEEFADDAILQQLRQQRTLHENQLREIDELLAAMEPNT